MIRTLIASIALFGIVGQVQAKPLAGYRTPQAAIRKALKAQYPNIKFQKPVLTPTNVAGSDSFVATSKIPHGSKMLGITAQGTVGEGLGGWRADIK